MKRKGRALLPAYRAALGRYLKQGTAASLQPAQRLGHRALAIGLATLDLAQIHEIAVLSTVEALPPAKTTARRERLARRAGTFFSKAILPIEATHRTAVETNAQLRALRSEISQRNRELKAANRKLLQEIERHKCARESTRKSKKKFAVLLAQSREFQGQLRFLSRQVLSAQEEERRRISRELHDLVAQTLTAINVHLATLKTEAMRDAKGMNRKIARAQKLVERSVDKVHRFARELRPAVLDDLGLIPALHSLLEHFAKESGVRVKMTACAKVEELNSDRRTILYRVAQEALRNVARHAQAGHVTVDIKEQPNAVCMRIHDDGRSFDVERLLHAGKSKRMGLLGMRERVEMVGGLFAIESAPGKGTTVTATVPLQSKGKENRRT